MSPQLATRNGRWKLLCNPDGSNEKLFDLEQDIGETTNLSVDRPEVVTEMKSKLMAWWREMDGYYDAK